MVTDGRVMTTAETIAMLEDVCGYLPWWWIRADGSWSTYTIDPPYGFQPTDDDGWEEAGW